MSTEEVIVPVVIDTNTLVPSLYRETYILKFILAGNIVLIWNNFIYQEVKRISERLFYDLYQKVADANDLDKVLKIIDMIFYEGNKVREMPVDWPKVSKDRDDDPFLFAADEGGAEYIISKDKPHMLEMGNFKGIPIGEPKDFFEWVKINHPL